MLLQSDVSCLQARPEEIKISVCFCSTSTPRQSATLKVPSCHFYIFISLLLRFSGGVIVPESLGQLSKSGGEGSGGSLEDRSGGEEFSLKELYAVQEIQSQPDLFRLIVQ